MAIMSIHITEFENFNEMHLLINIERKENMNSMKIGDITKLNILLKILQKGNLKPR
jgi:hypothetical protein